MPGKVTKSKKITGESIEELSTIILQESNENQQGSDEQISTLDRIKARGKIKKNVETEEILKAGLKRKTKAKEEAEDTAEEKAKPKRKTKTKEEAEDTAEEKAKPKRKTKTKEEAEDTVEEKTKPKRKTKAKEEAEDTVEEKAKPKRKTKAKEEAEDTVEEKAKPKRKTKAKEEAEDTVEEKAKPKRKTRAKEEAEDTVEEEAKPKRKTKIKEESEKPLKKTSVKDLLEEKLEGKTGRKRTKQTKKEAEKGVSKVIKADITLGELLEQAKEEPGDDKDSTKRLKNISETIRADSSKRKRRKNDAALVMATMTGGADDVLAVEVEKKPILAGFPIDVSHIDFEKERYEAEEECIEDFRRSVNRLSQTYEEIKLHYDGIKDEVINSLIENDRDSQQQMKELKIKQNDLVNKIAEIQEVILNKKSELDSLGLTAFYKKNRLKQVIAESEAEIAGLEMEALGYNSKLMTIVDTSATERKELFKNLEFEKHKVEELKKRLTESKLVLEAMENREKTDENAVQKKLILKALKLYQKPITIGQLLYYPGLSGCSVQRMSAAINQLVVEQSVLKVALEDNVYYLIADHN